MRLIDADKLYPDCLTKKGTLAISQSQIASAPTVEPFEPDYVGAEKAKGKTMIKLPIDKPKCCIDCPVFNCEFGSCQLIENGCYYNADGQLYDPFSEIHRECPIIEE